MKIIEPSVEIINESDPFKKIELAGRTCYKSEANITEDSAHKLFKRLYENQHFAMLEHATFIFKTTNYNTYLRAKNEKFINATIKYEDGFSTIIISGNLRAILESKLQELKNALAIKYEEFKNLYQSDCTTAQIISFEDIINPNEDEINNHKYTTMRFITDRGVTHELVRHRLFSFAQESTRYVNYNKNDMHFIKPAEYDEWNISKQNIFIKSNERTEAYYKELISVGATPQEARAVLTNAIKTEIVVTGNNKEWQHFFDLRYKGTTGKPHPDMQKVAELAYDLYEEV